MDYGRIFVRFTGIAIVVRGFLLFVQKEPLSPEMFQMVIFLSIGAIMLNMKIDD